METFAHYAPIVGLLFFFCVFVGIALWTWLPRNKKEFQRLGMMPLKEDNHE